MAATSKIPAERVKNYLKKVCATPRLFYEKVKDQKSSIFQGYTWDVQYLKRSSAAKIAIA